MDIMLNVINMNLKNKMPFQYNKKVMQHFLKAKHVGKIENADGIGKVGNMTCGDVMYIYIKVGKKGGDEIIKDIKFETLGCPAAIATSDIIASLAKGKSLNEAMKITNKEVVKALGELPAAKYHCSLLAEEGLGEAIYDYLKKNGRKIPSELEKKHKKAIASKKEFECRYGK